MAHSKNWGLAPFIITYYDGKTFPFRVSGRDRWALEALIEAGANGWTPIDTPGPRWSGYVFNLRQLGIDIETVHEPHDGPFRGTHARYVLRSRVVRLTNAADAA